tara:strand:- start:329 stop:1042 length:714 start_codon:yes stop_codon:yes gene_type:complete
MTDLLFQKDSYLKKCEAIITNIVENSIELNCTVFYPQGGGQPGDSGKIYKEDGNEILIHNTIKDSKAKIFHQSNNEIKKFLVGDKVIAEINWKVRYIYMKMHTCLHLLSAVLPYPVTGGKIGAEKSSLDFNIPEPKLNKEEITQKINQLVELDFPISQTWISDAELENKSDLIKTMSVKPPKGTGSVRLVKIGDEIDLQPCGGTHIKFTSEIGKIKVIKIENKGKKNRRITLVIENK